MGVARGRRGGGDAQSAGLPICTAGGCPEGVRHTDVPHEVDGVEHDLRGAVNTVRRVVDFVHQTSANREERWVHGKVQRVIRWFLDCWFGRMDFEQQLRRVRITQARLWATPVATASARFRTNNRSVRPWNRPARCFPRYAKMTELWAIRPFSTSNRPEPARAVGTVTVCEYSFGARVISICGCAVWTLDWSTRPKSLGPTSPASRPRTTSTTMSSIRANPSHRPLRPARGGGRTRVRLSPRRFRHSRERHERGPSHARGACPRCVLPVQNTISPGLKLSITKFRRRIVPRP